MTLLPDLPVHLRPAFCIALLALGTGCGNESPTAPPVGSGTASITVLVTAGGNGADADGFGLQFDSLVSPAAANISLSWDSLPGGPHTLQFTGLAPQCHSEPASLAVQLTPGRDTTVTMRVVCYGELAYSGWADAEGWQLFYLDADGTTRQLTDFPRSNFARGWSPDGSRLVFTSMDPATYEQDIYTIRPDGTDLQQLTSGVTDDFEPRWSPDGTRIVFYRNPTSSFPAPTVQLIDADGNNEHPAFGNTVGDFDPVWNATGTELIFSCSRFGHNWDLCAAAPDGGGLQYTAGVLGLQYAVGSPTGGGVAFEAWPTGKQSVFVMAWNGSGLRDLSPTTSSYDFRWSPDGQWLTLNTYDGTHFGMRLVPRAAGTGAIPISDSAGASDWAPDNSLIAFDSWEGGGLTQIWIVRPDGSGKQRITASPMYVVHPLWRPTARPESTRAPAPRMAPPRAPVRTMAPRSSGRPPMGLARPLHRSDGCLVLPGNERGPCRAP